MRKYSRVDDRKFLDDAWDWHAKFMPEAPYPPADGYQLVLQGHCGEKSQSRAGQRQRLHRHALHQRNGRLGVIKGIVPKVTRLRLVFVQKFKVQRSKRVSPIPLNFEHLNLEPLQSFAREASST